MTIATLIALVVFAMLAATGRASRYPQPPAWWLRGALCVHAHESTDWHIYNPPYSGGMQFMDGTWRSAGGRGRAADASPEEQLYRAWLVYSRDRRSGDHDGWREWPNTARACGLR